MKRFNQISNYWHIEVFVFMPWFAYLTYLLYNIHTNLIDILKILG